MTLGDGVTVSFFAPSPRVILKFCENLYQNIVDKVIPF